MEKTRRTVDELNELAEKMTGVNPKARTDAQALNYIEQHYTPGGGGGSCNCPIYFIDSILETIEGGSVKITLDLTGSQLRNMMSENNNKLIIKTVLIDEEYGNYFFMDMDEVALGETRDRITFKTPNSMSQSFGEAITFDSIQDGKFSWNNVPPS